MGHDGPKLAQGPLWAQNWAPPKGLWAMMGPSLPRAHYGPKLRPPWAMMGHTYICIAKTSQHKNVYIYACIYLDIYIKVYGRVAFDWCERPVLT